MSEATGRPGAAADPVRSPVIDAIHARRSVRRFTDEAVPKDVVRAIVDAARMAPSGGNRQMWRFRALTARDTISALRAEVELKVAGVRERVSSPRARAQYDGYAAHFGHFDGAPVVIAVLAREYDSIYTRILRKYVPEEERPRQHLVDVAAMSVAAAIENMLLAAHALGYGGCFMTGPMIAQREIEALLGVEEPWHVVAIVPVGRPSSPVGRPGGEPDERPDERPAGGPPPRERTGLDEILSFD